MADRYKKLQRWLFGLSIIVVVIIAGLVLCKYYADRHNQTNEQVAVANARMNLLRAIEATKLPAPVEAKTGDVYFPEAKLYVPRAAGVQGLTYVVDTEAGNPGLLVSSRSLLDQALTEFSNAQTNVELFEILPRLQACQRGVYVTYSQLSDGGQSEAGYDDLEMHGSARLTNGKDIYLYAERQCPEAKELAGQLKTLRTY